MLKKLETNSKIAVELKDVYKSFGSNAVLSGFNMQVRKGETMVILGGSGTGKSISIRHIVGLLNPDRGQVFVQGEEMSFCSERKRARLRSYMGVLFQSGALINWLSVYDNVSLPLQELQLAGKDEIHRRVVEKLRWLGLMPAKNLFPSDISGGMKKRTGLARALVTNPKILLYDEPTSGLDPVMSQVINDLIVRTKKEMGVTQIVVTHDMKSAYYIADHIAFLYKGRVLCIGTPDEIRNSSNEIVQQFINGAISGPIDLDAEEAAVTEAKGNLNKS